MTAPRIAIIVANSVSGDSRVIKTAASARRLGAEVLVVGTSPTSQRDDSLIGDIPVVRVVAAPSGTTGRRIVSRSDGTWRLRPLAPIAFTSAGAYGRASDRRTRRRARTRTTIEGIKQRLRSDPGALDRITLRIRLDFQRARSLALDAWFVARRRAFVRPPIELGSTAHRSVLDHLLADRLPFVAGYVEAMTPILDEFEPDLIHAHDVFMAAVGASFAERSEQRGRRVPWIYDAHEWVAGLLAERAIAKTIAADELERLVAPTADAVVTVGDALAAELADELELRSDPVVILNAPPAWRGDRSRAGGIRSEFGLGEAPVLVYPGVVKPKRGIETAVHALVALPDVHLVLLADVDSPHVADIVSLARDVGVGERVHIRSYVPPDEIADFISDASMGIYPLTHYPNAEIAIPTKLLEYVQAGLPVVVSDTREMAAFVRRFDIGEVFRSGDVDDLVRAVGRVLADPNMYTGRCGASLAEEFTWERQEDRLRGVYSSVLDRGLTLVDAPFVSLAEVAGP